MFKLLILLSSIWALAADAANCRELMLKKAAAQHINVSVGLKFVVTELQPYPQASRLFPWIKTSVRDAYLEIDPGDDIAAISNILSIGRKSNMFSKLSKILGDGRTSVPLREILPANTLRRLEKQNSCLKSNCATAAFGFHRPLRSDEVIGTFDVLDRLSQDYRRLRSGDQLQFGDLIVLWDQDGNPRHLMIYLDDHLVFQKGSFEAEDPFVIQTLDAALAVYYDPTQFLFPPRFTFHRYGERDIKPNFPQIIRSSKVPPFPGAKK
jgi:hypothetical protein